MSANYIISCDSTADLPDSYIKEHGILLQYLSYNFGDEVYSGGRQLDPAVFYKRMRNGEMPQTSAIVPEETIASFEPYLMQGYDILHIAFSSALSASCNNAMIAANELMDKYPARKIIVIDSLCASLGEGLLVHYAVLKKESGMSLSEVADWVTQNRLHICHQFTVNDLFHLHRGGRVSMTAAIVGTLINIKPVLHVDDAGKLIPLCNVRSRKKSLLRLVENMGEQINGYQNDIVFISHGDNLDDANFVAEEIKKRYGINNFLINYVCPTIGSHSGPDTIALFFLGEKR